MDPVSILSELVGFRSDVFEGEEGPLAARLADLMRERKADEVVVVEAARAEGLKSASWVFARYGQPKVVVNAHLDTVPPNADWVTDPFKPHINDGKLYALGASDTKGAAAAILSALDEVTPKNMAVLFSGDEEYSSVAMRSFLKSDHAKGLERAIVCEPTNLGLGVRHRGFVAFHVTVSSPGGHSSRADFTVSPIALLARVAVAIDDWGKAHKDEGPAGFEGMCLNLAKLDGGVAFNVIPAEARLVVSFRPPPGANTKQICTELEQIIASVTKEAKVEWQRVNIPFATKDIPAFTSLLGKEKPIDLAFWTEAALLSEAGIDAVVMGTGDIAQAHAPNEWVTLKELEEAKNLFRDLFSRS